MKGEAGEGLLTYNDDDDRAIIIPCGGGGGGEGEGGWAASRRKGRHIILTTEHLKEELLLLLLSFPVPFIQSVILCRGVSAVATIRIYSQMADEEPQQSFIYADHDGDASQT